MKHFTHPQSNSRLNVGDVFKSKRGEGKAIIVSIDPCSIPCSQRTDGTCSFIEKMTYKWIRDSHSCSTTLSGCLTNSLMETLEQDYTRESM